MGLVERKVRLIFIYIFTLLFIVFKKIYKFLFQEVDFCIALTSLDRDKHNVMDTSFPVIFDSTSIVIPFPQETNKPIALLFTAFHWDVRIMP